MQLRNRLVKADFWTDTELIKELPVTGRVLYQGLWQLAEDSGCLEADITAYKMILFPMDNIDLGDIENWVQILIELEKLVPYEADGKQCYFITNFHKHQSLRNPGKPEIPLPNWIEYVPNDQPYKSGGYIIDYSKLSATQKNDIETVGNVNVAPEKEQRKSTVTNKNKKEKENLNKKEKENEKENRKEKSPLPSTPHQKIADLYNQHCPDMTKCIKISDRRKEHLRARWKDIYDLVKNKHDDLPEDELKEKMLAIFERLFKKAGASDFMNGDNDRSWEASLDWMIKNNNNFTKVLEGKYDNERMKNNNSPPGQEKSLEEMYQEGWR